MKLKDLFTNKKTKELETRIELLEKRLSHIGYDLELPSFPTPKIKTSAETLDYLLKSKKSMSRFGDGELFIALAVENKNFQNFNLLLSQRLKEILKSNDDNILICIHHSLKKLYHFTPKVQRFWLDFLAKKRSLVYSCLDMNKQYYDALVSRPYIDYADKSHCAEHFSKFKQLWQNEDIVVVEGEKTRLGVGNDLFENAKNIERILCPATNAFDKYDFILAECKKQDKDKTFVIALGPTATVLAYDLAKMGYRALDVGHIDIEYEWFLSSAKEKTIIKNKYTNEKKKGCIVGECKSPDYLKQIKRII